MNIWLALFAHLDIEAVPSVEDLLRLRGMGFSDFNREYFIDEQTFNTLRKFLRIRSVDVGGNAGNMAYFLGKLGVESNLSAPVRPRELTELFKGLPVYVWNHRRKLLSRASREDPAFAHIVLELRPPYTKEGARMIFTWDEMVTEGRIDFAFWEHVDNGILVVSGFHLIRNRRNLLNIIERVKGAREKGAKVYLECGEVTWSMSTAFKALLNHIDAVGMNEREAEKLLGANFIVGAKRLEKRGIKVTVHTPDWVYSTEKFLLRKAIDIVEAWAFGGSYTSVTHMVLKRAPDWAVPTRKLPYMARSKGLGDAFAALDAIRLFDPEMLDKIAERALKVFS